MGTNIGIFLTFGGILILLVLAGKFLLVPLKLLLKVIANSLIGAVILLILSYLGSFIGIFIPINVVTALTVGILGIPGTIMIIIFCL